MLDSTVLSALEAEGSATFATIGPRGAHLVATWQSYLEVIDDGTLIFPAGGYRATEVNLANDPSVQMVIGSRRGTQGAIGFRLTGTAHLEAGSALHERLKLKHPWCRAAVVMRVTGVERILG